MQAPLVRVRGLRVAHGGQVALRDASFDLQAGERLAVVGGSGSGKTTLARALLRLDNTATTQAAELRVAGVDLLTATTEQLRCLRGAGVGFAMQETLATLDPLQRIQSALAEAHGLHRPTRGAAVLTLLRRLLDSVGLDDADRILRAYPHELSGGQRQRVGLALALAAQPQLLIADEPTSALDGPKTRELAVLLRELATGERGWPPMSLLLISHDMRLVAACCTRALVLENGEIVDQGPIAQLFSEPNHAATHTLLAHAGLAAPPPEISRAVAP